jgi:hypothetical protein
VQGARAVGEDGDDEDLRAEPREQQPGGPQLELGERPEAPARERHRGQAEQEDDADQHLQRSSAHR